MSKYVHPWRAVLESKLEYGGQSIFPPYLPLGCTWELKLECGHSVYRAVRFNKDNSRYYNSVRYKRGWWHRRNPEDALPAPKRVRCERCDPLERTP